jgi:serine/threonine protein kinase
VLLDAAVGLPKTGVVRAVVADFGTSRLVRPPPAAVDLVESSFFTGDRIALPDGAVVSLDLRTGATLRELIATFSAVDSHGVMSRASGTLLWMAPEVFRGDTNYTSAADVYSYALVMYELATRRVPWDEIMSTTETEFFNALNTSLQRGFRPSLSPDVCAEHAEYVVIMKQCWAGDPSDRPDFDAVVRQLAGCLRREIARSTGN